MSKWQKLLDRLRDMDASLRYEELNRLLEYYGYVCYETRGGSSHVTFRKPGKEIITIPRHNPINKAYIRLVRDAVEEAIAEEQK